MIDPAAILTLLVPGPCSSDDLIAALGQPPGIVRHELGRLLRRGTLKKVGQDRSYALASYVAPRGRPLTLGRTRRTIGAKSYMLCTQCQQSHQKHQGLCRACARAAGLYTKKSWQEDRERQQRRTVQRAQTAPPVVIKPVRPTTCCVIDGQEFDVVDFDALLAKKAKDWPGRGSSLSVPFFERPRFTSRDVRRGAHS